MSLERLWAGWRSGYVTEAASADRPAARRGGEDGCLFCTLATVEDSEGLVLERTELTFSVLNAFPYTTGHLMVVPRRHEDRLEALDEREASALFAALQRAIVALTAAMRPEGTNVGANLGRAAGAGVPGHLHLHALPRWSGDTNFMTSVAEARVLPEDLRTTWHKLRQAWPSG
ncbi:MAG: HIT family protein [Acidimicrobiia bacterium]